MKERNYGIDLLRLLLMFMVVLLHTFGNGGVLSSVELFSSNYFLAWTLECLCYCAVNCYAIISGYVSYGRKYSFVSMLTIWIQAVGYTLTISAFFWIFTDNSPSISYFLDAFFKSSNNSLWYISAYTGVYIFIPVLNSAIKSFTKDQAKVFLVVSTLFLPVLTTFLRVDPFSLQNGYSVIWIAYLYLIGAIIRKFRFDQMFFVRRSTLIYLLCIGIVLGSKISIALLTNHVLGEVRFDMMLVKYVSPPMLMAAVALFLAFVNLDIGTRVCKLIKYFSPAAFGVYLIHCQPYIFTYCAGRFAFLAERSPLAMTFGVFCISALIYIPCIAIDLVRIYIFQKLKIKERLVKFEQKYLSWCLIFQ